MIVRSPLTAPDTSVLAIQHITGNPVTIIARYRDTSDCVSPFLGSFAIMPGISDLKSYRASKSKIDGKAKDTKPGSSSSTSMLQALVGNDIGGEMTSMKHRLSFLPMLLELLSLFDANKMN
ncbi:hypothetical protein NPIL_695291 [Nephila pilipes]|uniref:Uncharacterized protein n=1 Tax=Nephila pilipes TaxID=299642 RepID=A0A8X6QBR4_NEPPI|nr:hypothetical protein NPIL_695291 [Nephila pilipes]